MRSATFTLMLICALGVGPSLFAQGRGGGSAGGRGGGAPSSPTGPEPTVSRPTPEPDRGKSSGDHAPNANADPRSAQSATNDAARQLAGNSGLSAQVAKLFPDGTDLGLMAGGFKNLGAFVSAAHVSKNLGIPFDQIKTRMVRDGSSLGDAIHALKPELGESGAKAEAMRAEERAKKDISDKN
jgi:hypothetical protein